MPFARPHVTSASRIMLPVYPIFAGVVGINYIVTPDRVLVNTPTLQVASQVMPLTTWGLAFTSVALVLVMAMILGRRWIYTTALVLLGSMMAVWTGINAMAALTGQASPGAWVWPAFVLTSTWASAGSLNRRETDNA